jgi:hypothetical protein
MVLFLTRIASSRTANYVSNGRANYLDSHLGQISSTGRILLLKGEEIILTDAVQQHIVRLTRVGIHWHPYYFEC